MVSVSLEGDRLGPAEGDTPPSARLRSLQERWDAVSGRLLELQRRRSGVTDPADGHTADPGDRERADGQVRR